MDMMDVVDMADKVDMLRMIDMQHMLFPAWPNVFASRAAL